MQRLMNLLSKQRKTHVLRLSQCLLILLIIFFSSCNAPHDNPFDPLSPDYEDTDIIDSSSCIEVSARAINHASYGPLSVHALDIEATIIDTNGVDHVWVRLDTIEIGTLHTGENTQTWFRRLDETQLPNRGLGDLIGRTLTLYYLNDMGRVSDGVEFQLYRVLYEVPQTIFPDNDTLLTTKQPQLEWISYDADFSFTYSVKILHIVEGSTEGILVYSYEEIHSDSTTHTVGDSLTNAPDFMVWTVTVVDEFGNEARSLTANFRIDDNE